MMKKSKKTQINTSLPYALLNIDDRFFKIGDKHETEIRFKKVQTTPNRRVSSMQNMHTIRDRWGIDFHSEIQINSNKVMADLEKAEKFALDLINNFIKKYKYHSDEDIHLVELTSEDLFGFDFICDGKGMFSMSLSGGVKTIDPLKIHKISSDMSDFLMRKNEVPFDWLLIHNSKRHLQYGEYRYAILESVISLEMVLYKFLEKRMLTKEIKDKDIKSLIKDVGLTGNVNTTIKLVLEPGESFDSSLCDKCKSAITQRNNIVHKGANNFSHKQTKELISDVELLINEIKAIDS